MTRPQHRGFMPGAKARVSAMQPVRVSGSSGFRCESFNQEPTATAEDRPLRRRWLRVKRRTKDVCT